MGNLFVLYCALTVFGLGITLVDFFGIFDHTADHGDGDGTADHPGDGDPGHGVSPDHGSQLGSAEAGSSPQNHRQDRRQGRGFRAVTGILGVLRLAVYFALGAGPTGLFALLTGLNPRASLLWSLGAGMGIAILTRSLRKLLRRDLDSTISPEDLLMEKASILVPVAPGAMGKAAVRNFGREREVYVRCRDPAASFPKGAEVRIADYDEQCYWIEPVDYI